MRLTSEGDASMGGIEFAQAVRECGDLEIVRDNDHEYVIKCKTNGKCCSIRKQDVGELQWEDTYDVLRWKRPAHIMLQMTRCVGYYSKLSNWNRSKLAELRDRHRGNYTVPEQTILV